MSPLADLEALDKQYVKGNTELQAALFEGFQHASRTTGKRKTTHLICLKTFLSNY
jgi:hypothetical protein